MACFLVQNIMAIICTWEKRDSTAKLIFYTELFLALLSQFYVHCEIRVKTLISKQSQREGMQRGRTEWNKNDELTYDEFFMKNYQ